MAAGSEPVRVSLRVRGAAPAPVDPHTLPATKVEFVVAPGAAFSFPPLAPASIKGHLEAEGAVVAIHDVNIAAFTNVCSDAMVDHYFEVIRKRERELRDLAASAPDKQHFLDHVLALNATQIDQLRGLPGRLRDLPTFLHDTAYSALLHDLAIFEQIVELAYYPIQFLPGSLIGGMFARCRTLAELLTATTPYDATVDRALAARDWAEADIIAFTAFSFDQLVFSMRMADRLRPLAPHALFVLGGNILVESTIPESFQQSALERFDVMIVGDGEQPMSQLREHVHLDRPLSAVANAVWLDGSAIRQSTTNYKFRYDTAGQPDFDGYHLDEYPMPGLVLPFRFSNGCDWGRCTFCAESADRGEMSSRLVYTETPAEAACEHMTELRDRWGAEALLNCSSQITAAGCAEIGEAIEAAGLDLRWAAMVRSENGWSDERIQQAAAGGSRALNFGIESFVPRINRLMKKGVNLRSTVHQLSEFRRNNVAVTLYTLMNYPTETLDEYREHLRVVEENIDAFDHVFKNIFMLVADAPAVAELAKLGVEVPEQRIEDLSNGEFPYYMIPNDRSSTHYSSGYAFRWEGDQLEEKDDEHHRMLLRLIEQRPMYFDRHLEIASHRKWWQPEYVMIDDRHANTAQLPGLTYHELLDASISLSPGAVLQRLDRGLGVITLGRRPAAFYLSSMEADFLELVFAKQPGTAAMQAVVDRYQPTAQQLVQLYHTVHGRLRSVELIEVDAVRSPEADTLIGASA